jgi:hypothetical protein
MGLNLTSKADYKAYAGIKSTNEDAAIDFIIPKVSDLVKNYCGRTFVDHWETPKTEIFNGGVKKFILAETPIVNITSVQGSTDFGQTWTDLEQYKEWVQEDDTVLSLNATGYFPKWIRGYKVVYTAGYNDVPADLEMAVLDLVTYYRRHDSAVHSSKNVGSNNVQIEYISTTSLPAHIRRILDLYRADFT